MSEKEKAKRAFGAVEARLRGLDGKVLRKAGAVAVSRAFDLFVEHTPERERAKEVGSLIRSGYVQHMHQIGGYPESLHGLAVPYLEAHLDDVNSITDEQRRFEILWELAKRGSQQGSVMALNYIAQGPSGVDLVARLYGDGQLRIMERMTDAANRSLNDWAIKICKKVCRS